VNIQEANWQDLFSTYYRHTDAVRAATFLEYAIDELSSDQLSRLLRHHGSARITSKFEIEMRSAVDDLLNCYSIMEIASEVAFIPSEVAYDFARNAKIILSNLQVRRFYVDHYPLKLPRLYLARLQRRFSNGEPNLDTTNLFLELLALDQQFMRDLSNGTLLKLLDDFIIEGDSFERVITLLGSPQEFLERIFRPPDQREHLDRVLQELSLFFQFCFNLHSLLIRCTEHRMLQSSIWNYYSYWFGIIGEHLKDKLGKALIQFQKWSPDSNNDQAKELRSFIYRSSEVIENLVSPQFAEPVDARLVKLQSDFRDL
jgi:hypothetical protein